MSKTQNDNRGEIRCSGSFSRFLSAHVTTFMQINLGQILIIIIHIVTDNLGYGNRISMNKIMIRTIKLYGKTVHVVATTVSTKTEAFSPALCWYFIMDGTILQHFTFSVIYAEIQGHLRFNAGRTCVQPYW